MHWYANSKCESVSSVGDLHFFKEENAPEGATDRCLDCPHMETCPYSAKEIYINRWHRDGEPEFVDRYAGFPKTAANWPVTPECFYWGVRFIYERYKLPFIITENGTSIVDVVSLDGKVHDPNRIDFLNRHLLELEKAIDDGVNVKGYFQWSLMDNFEWAKGYNDRFGLIYVDYETQQRIPKDSFYWYKNWIEEHTK